MTATGRCTTTGSTSTYFWSSSRKVFAERRRQDAGPEADCSAAMASDVFVERLIA